jgi:hypothetical protein
MMESIGELEATVVWKKNGASDDEMIPEPQPGMDKLFDSANANVNAVKEKIDQYL